MTEDKDPAFVSHAAFDDFASDYDCALNKGLSLSGEPPDYFASLRVEYTARWLRALGISPLSAVDFGCGVGNSTRHFRRHFPKAELLGLDVSAASIERAGKIHGHTASFRQFDEAETGHHDLVYCNGVFHHIAPRERGEWAVRVRNMLTPGGFFALWENNPWNPGTRMVMRRIPFDRDAIPLSAPAAQRMLVRAGFAIAGTRFRFYFPRILRALRGLERLGERVPLGAQYCVLGRKPSGQP